MTTHTIAILALKASMNRRLKTAENNFELNEEKNQEMNGHKRQGEIYKIELIKRIEVEPATGMTLSEEVAAKAAQYNEEVEGNIMCNMVLSQKDKTEIEIDDKSNGILYTEIYDIDECLLSTKFDNEELDGAETPNDKKFNITRTCDIINEEMGAETPRPNEENNIAIKCDINDEIGIVPECDINNGINRQNLISHKIDELAIDELAIDELAIDEIGIAPEWDINNDEESNGQKPKCDNKSNGISFSNEYNITNNCSVDILMLLNNVLCGNQNMLLLLILEEESIKGSAGILLSGPKIESTEDVLEEALNSLKNANANETMNKIIYKHCITDSIDIYIYQKMILNYEVLKAGICLIKLSDYIVDVLIASAVNVLSMMNNIVSYKMLLVLITNEWNGKMYNLCIIESINNDYNDNTIVHNNAYNEALACSNSNTFIEIFKNNGYEQMENVLIAQYKYNWEFNSNLNHRFDGYYSRINKLENILAQNCVNVLDEMSSSGVLLSKLFYSNVLFANENDELCLILQSIDHDRLVLINKSLEIYEYLKYNSITRLILICLINEYNEYFGQMLNDNSGDNDIEQFNNTNNDIADKIISYLNIYCSCQSLCKSIENECNFNCKILDLNQVKSPVNEITDSSGTNDILSEQPRDLVPGDICDLTLGMAVLADVSIINYTPELQKRDWKPTDETPTGSANLCFFGTLVVNDKGRGVVIATGDEICMGPAQLAISTAKEIKDFVFKISLIAFVLGIIFFIIGMVENGNLVANVIFLIGGIFIIGCDNGIILYLAINASLNNSRNNRISNALLNKFKQKIKKLYCNYEQDIINGYRFDEYNHEEIKLLRKSTSLNVLSSIIMKKKIYEQCLDDGTIIDSNVASGLEQYLQTRQSRALSGNNILVKLNNVNDLDFKNQTEFKTHNKYITQIIKNNQILITLSNVLIANNNDNNTEESTSNINGDVNVFSCTFVVLTVTLSVFDATFFVFDGILVQMVQMVYLALLWKLLSKSMCNIEQLFNIRCKCNNKITNRQELINIHGFNESNVWYCNLQIIKIFKNKLIEDVFHNENTLHLSKNKFAEKCIEIENELNKTNALKKHLVLCCDDEYDRRVDQSFTKVYVIKLYENNAHLFLSQVKFNNEVQCIFNKNQWYKNLLQINKGRNSLMNDKFKFDSNILHLLKDKQGSNGIETCIFVANNKQIKKILLKQLILECNEFVFVTTLSFNKENIFADIVNKVLIRKITLFKLDTLDITIIILLQINVSNVIARKTNIQQIKTSTNTQNQNVAVKNTNIHQIKTFEIKMNNGQNENYINGIITESLTFKKMINEEYDNELIKYLNCSNNVWFDLLIAVLSGVAVLLVCIWYGQMIELLIQLYDLLKCSSRICDINELKNINKQEIDDDIIKIVIILFENRSKCIRQNNDHENIIGCMKTMESLIIFQSNYEQIKYRNYNDTVKSINWDTFVKQKQLQIILETSYINMCINVELQFEIKLLIADRMRIKLYKIIQHYVSKILIKCESNDKLRLKHLKNDTLSFDLYSEIYSLNIYINTNIGNSLIYLHAIVLDQSQNNDLFNNQNMNKFNGGNNSGSLLIQFCNLYKTSITLHNINDYAQLMNQFYKQNIQEVNSKFGISWQWLFGLCGILVIMSLFKAYQCGKITEILIYIGYSIPYELLSGKISHYNQYNNCSLVNHVSMDLYAYIFAMLGVLTKYYYSIRRQLLVFKESTCSFLSVLCVDTDYVKVYANEIKSLCLIDNCKSCQFLDINGKSLNDTNLQISCLIEWVYRMHNLRLVLDATIRKKLKETILKILGIFVKILMYSLLIYIGQIVSGVLLNETRHIWNGLNKNKICIDTKESDIKQAIEIFITTVEIECKDNNSNITLIIGLFEVISSIIYHFESEKYNDKICRLEVEICLEFIINKVELIHEEKVNVSNVPLQLYYYENKLIYYNKCAENEDYSLQKHLLYENIIMNHGDKFGYITTYACEPGEYYKLALSSRLDESSGYYNLVVNSNNNIYRNKCNEFIGSFSGSLIEYNNGNDVNIEYNLTIDSKIGKSVEHGMYSNNDSMNNTNHCVEDEYDGDKINLNDIEKEEYKINTIKIGIVITLSLILLSSMLCIVTVMNIFYCSLYFSILWTYVCFTNERIKCLSEMKEHCQVLGFCGSYLSELYTLAAVYSHISKTRQISLKYVVNMINISIYTLNTVFVLSQQQQQQNDQFQKYISKINSFFEASCKDIKRIDESVLKSGIKLLFEAAYYCHDTFESVNTWIAILAIVFDTALFSLFCSKWYSVMSIFMEEMATSLLAQFSLVIMGMISGVINVYDNCNDNIDTIYNRNAALDVIDSSSNKYLSELKTQSIELSLKYISCIMNYIQLLLMFDTVLSILLIKCISIIIFNRFGSNAKQNILDIKNILLFKTYGKSLEYIQYICMKKRINPSIGKNMSKLACSIAWSRQLLRGITISMNGKIVFNRCIFDGQNVENNAIHQILCNTLNTLKDRDNFMQVLQLNKLMQPNEQMINFCKNIYNNCNMQKILMKSIRLSLNNTENENNLNICCIGIDVIDNAFRVCQKHDDISLLINNQNEAIKLLLDYNLYNEIEDIKLNESDKDIDDINEINVLYENELIVANGIYMGSSLQAFKWQSNEILDMKVMKEVLDSYQKRSLKLFENIINDKINKLLLEDLVIKNKLNKLKLTSLESFENVQHIVDLISLSTNTIQNSLSQMRLDNKCNQVDCAYEHLQYLHHRINNDRGKLVYDKMKLIESVLNGIICKLLNISNPIDDNNLKNKCLQKCLQQMNLIQNSKPPQQLLTILAAIEEDNSNDIIVSKLILIMIKQNNISNIMYTCQFKHNFSIINIKNKQININLATPILYIVIYFSLLAIAFIISISETNEDIRLWIQQSESELNAFVSDEINTTLYNKTVDYDESVVFNLILLLTLANLMINTIIFDINIIEVIELVYGIVYGILCNCRYIMECIIINNNININMKVSLYELIDKLNERRNNNNNINVNIRIEELNDNNKLNDIEPKGLLIGKLIEDINNDNNNISIATNHSLSKVVFNYVNIYVSFVSDVIAHIYYYIQILVIKKYLMLYF